MSDHSASHGQFPSWVSLKDKHLLQLEAGHIFNIVVAVDHTGNLQR